MSRLRGTYEQPKTNSEYSSHRRVQGWPCRMCSFENHYRSHRCEICMADRDCVPEVPIRSSSSSHTRLGSLSTTSEQLDSPIRQTRPTSSLLRTLARVAALEAQRKPAPKATFSHVLLQRLNTTCNKSLVAGENAKSMQSIEESKDARKATRDRDDDNKRSSILRPRGEYAVDRDHRISLTPGSLIRYEFPVDGQPMWFIGAIYPDTPTSAGRYHVLFEDGEDLWVRLSQGSKGSAWAGVEFSTFEREWAAFEKSLRGSNPEALDHLLAALNAQNEERARAKSQRSRPRIDPSLDKYQLSYIPE